MTYHKPYNAVELDVHPDADRIRATFDEMMEHLYTCVNSTIDAPDGGAQDIDDVMEIIESMDSDLIEFAEHRKVSEWHPIETVPRDGKTWVVARMQSSCSPTGWWEATVIFHEDADHWTDGQSVMHYNGTVLVSSFRGTFTDWRHLKEEKDHE